MRPDELLRALDLLPEPLHDRARELRVYLKPRRCDQCRAVGDAVRLALSAAHYDELTSAQQLLDNAEALAGRQPARASRQSSRDGDGSHAGPAPSGR